MFPFSTIHNFPKYLSFSAWSCGYCEVEHGTSCTCASGCKYDPGPPASCRSNGAADKNSLVPVKITVPDLKSTTENVGEPAPQ